MQYMSSIFIVMLVAIVILLSVIAVKISYKGSYHIRFVSCYSKKRETKDVSPPILSDVIPIVGSIITLEKISSDGVNRFIVSKIGFHYHIGYKHPTVTVYVRKWR